MVQIYNMLQVNLDRWHFPELRSEESGLQTIDFCFHDRE